MAKGFNVSYFVYIYIYLYYKSLKIIVSIASVLFKILYEIITY